MFFFSTSSAPFCLMFYLFTFTWKATFQVCPRLMSTSSSKLDFWNVFPFETDCIYCSIAAKTARLEKRQRRRRMWQPFSTNFRLIVNRCGFTCTSSSASGVTNHRPSSISVPFRPTLKLRTVGSCTSSFSKTEAPHLIIHFRGKPIPFFSTI